MTPLDQGALAALLFARSLAMHAGSVWPGYALQNQEILAYDGARRQILVGATAPPAGFVPVPGPEPGVWWHSGPLPSIADAPTPAVYLAGWPIVALPYPYLETDYQPQPQRIFAPAFGAWAQRHFASAAPYDRLSLRAYPASDRVNATQAQAEDRALSDALLTGNTVVLRSMVRRFLALRFRRRRRLASYVSQLEDLTETMSGIPHYVADAYLDRIAAVDRKAASGRTWLQSTAGLAGALVLPLDPGASPVDRLQLTGLAQARLLDRLGVPSWQLAVERGAALDSLLARAVMLR